MPHPLLEQFCRIPGIDACRPDFFRRMQRELRDDIQPMLDQREALLAENAELKAQLEKATGKKAAKGQAEPVTA
jgi:hypothetical protein